ncbi:hypothetical protein DPMN_134181 [Dreissena polymorpha]|uniref:Uncharacterized protein n=1 Tax=Dreissena polymorpha TaxID=45954 RepID=A0A9D4FZA3_DREPO|nr:hypothetical protein DPMN_134181 [Dreissena polymorpha]
MTYSSDEDSESESDVAYQHSTSLVNDNNAPPCYKVTSILDQIPKSLKKQIWANKCVDLSQLLSIDPLAHQQTNNLIFQMDKFSYISLVPRT